MIPVTRYTQWERPDPHARAIEKTRAAVLLPPELATAIAFYARTHGQISQAQAIRELLNKGLAAHG